MKSIDILNNAKNLFDISDPKDESMSRTIISRSYYSVFHGALELFKYRYNWPTSPISNVGVHEKLYSRFDNHDFVHKDKIKEAAKLKNQLIIFKKQRVKADYKLDMRVTALDARYSISEAERILQDLHNI